jgi:hypothetical protein
VDQLRPEHRQLTLRDAIGRLLQKRHAGAGRREDEIRLVVPQDLGQLVPSDLVGTAEKRPKLRVPLLERIGEYGRPLSEVRRVRGDVAQIDGNVPLQRIHQQRIAFEMFLPRDANREVERRGSFSDVPVAGEQQYPALFEAVQEPLHRGVVADERLGELERHRPGQTFRVLRCGERALHDHRLAFEVFRDDAQVVDVLLIDVIRGSGGCRALIDDLNGPLPAGVRVDSRRRAGRRRLGFSRRRKRRRLG